MGSQAFFSHAEDGGISNGIDPELAQALLLVRVSTIKMLRLQLALERRDRSVAMQQVDDLMDLDAWMALIGGHRADKDLLDAIAGEAQEERSALLHEKFGLAAGLVKREAEPGPRPWLDPVPPDAEQGALKRGSDPAVAEEPYDFLGTSFVMPEEELPVRRRGWLLAFTIFVLLLAAGAGAALMLGWRPDILINDLLAQGGI